MRRPVPSLVVDIAPSPERGRGRAGGPGLNPRKEGMRSQTPSPIGNPRSKGRGGGQSLSYMIPVGIPAMLGVVESAMRATFVSLGVAPAMASSASILTRAIAICSEVAVTGPVTVFYSADVFRGLFERRSRSPVHGDEPKVVSRPNDEVR